VTSGADAQFAALLLSPFALAVLGLCIGSFLNVVIHRLPIIMEREWWADMADQLRDEATWKRLFPNAPAVPSAVAGSGAAIESELAKLGALSLASPRSRCPACGHQLAWHENIPVLGWLRLKGRCSACGTRISPRYPIVELATGLLFLACGLHFGPTAAALVWCAAAALLVAMTMIDIDTQYLPDDLTLPLIGLGILAAGAGWSGVSLGDAAWGAFWGYTSLWGVNWLFKRIRGVEGMGGGDFKLLAGLGALLGWKLLPAIVLLSSVVGAAVGVALIALRSHSWAKPIPFGPYLVGGGLAAAFFGGPLTRLYFPTL
jgi:leader peptidase (prepilin peptidase)/N-methyltransferase